MSSLFAIAVKMYGELHSDSSLKLCQLIGDVKNKIGNGKVFNRKRPKFFSRRGNFYTQSKSLVTGGFK